MMKQALGAIGLIGLINGCILWLAALMRSSVVDSWRKGPLIDPIAPYAPENAQWLFSVGLCGIINVYVLLLFLLRRQSRRPWLPLLCFLAATVLTEMGMQLYLSHFQQSYFRPHATLSWIVRPDLKDFPNQTGGGVINTNSDSMRGAKKWAPKGDAYRVLVLGDSSNFGHGVSDDEMWSAQLDQILNEASHSKIEVLNGACPGWTTFQGLEALNTRYAKYEPDLILVGFNNDSGPDFMPDKNRVSPKASIRQLNALLFHSELYLLGREAVLSIIRRFSSRAQAAYQLRLAGEKSSYGALSEGEHLKLVPRVTLSDFEANLQAFQTWAEHNDADFLWINMPINRREPELVERYVDFSYRSHIQAAAQTEELQVIDVDDYWLRTRESNLHIPAHLFHPNSRGHRRMAEQIAQSLLTQAIIPEIQNKAIRIGGPFPARNQNTLRLGYSTNSPVHAQIGMILSQHPELARTHQIDLELVPFDSGKAQGEALARHELDAWFSCAVPAIHMLDARPDSRILSGLGPMGKIAIITRKTITDISQLSHKRIGLSKGSTPELDWTQWSRDLESPMVINLPTAQLANALEDGTVDAIVTWDPWVSDWLNSHPNWHSLKERPFYSLLIGTHLWSIIKDGPIPRATRLLSLIEAALHLAAQNKRSLDEAFAAELQIPLSVSSALSDINPCLAGKDCLIAMTDAHKKTLLQALQFVHPREKSIDRILGEGLLKGEAFKPEQNIKPKAPPLPKP